MLNVASLEPRLANGPEGSIDGRRAKDVGCADPPVRRTVEHIRLEVYIVHLGARREAEAHASRLPCTIIRTLDNTGHRQIEVFLIVHETVTDQSNSDSVVRLLGDVVTNGRQQIAHLSKGTDDIRAAAVDCMRRRVNGLQSCKRREHMYSQVGTICEKGLPSMTRTGELASVEFRICQESFYQR